MSDLEDIRASAQAGQLVVVTGAGTSLSLASRATPAFDWPRLLQNAFAYAEKMGRIDDHQHHRWSETIGSGDLDELLGAAEFVSRKLDGRGGLIYARWLQSLFQNQKASSSAQMRGALADMTKAGVPVCTLNYDTLIERCTRLASINMKEPRKVLEWARRETPGILHLHGVWNEPETVVLGVSDYTDATNDEFRSNLQRALSTFNRLLFIGCGETLYDPNLSSLLRWMRSTLGTAGLQHYALVRNSEVEAKFRDPLWQGLVAPVGYGDDYAELPRFIVEQIIPETPDKRLARAGRTNSDSDVVKNYRRYLVSDCGKMTIEGVRADADTAKQKFDLERLFVPLEVDPIPPEIPANDPNREKKLKDWSKKNPRALPFGDALAKGGKLALLALPGGGKTLLLKRLAVAYADPTRRTATDDHLPDQDLLPILIRCREWRDHISLPISAIITKIFEITGQANLRGLFEAAQDRLSSGKIILLVDGLDEIHNDADRATFVENLERFLETYKKIRLVVTSREAGFALVAPSLMRFCSRWRIAPLSEDAIRLLCSHWHALMGGAGLEASEETKTVVETILANEALRRLAENPLLLTMLLVVKHGYGRLPPDRVSLYERAVEVLLDTWNIRGHAALNPREAVPQLAYIAFRMMQDGKQTATERELLALIEDCRREVPMVSLYAKDSPSDFLKRVELRSSLVLEAGKSLENGRTVPFYQFRHLTFQEYMAAIAVVEGHYRGYSEGDTVLEPFGADVANDEWKEVVPMAAVLAKKRASGLISELLLQAEREEAEFLSGGFTSSKYQWNSDYRMPASASRLLQCLVEEAEFSQANLERTLRIVATFAHGCQPQENWSALMRGPFGQSIFEQAWELFASGRLPRQAWLRNTVALMAFYRKPVSFWLSYEGLVALRSGLTSADDAERGKAAATICGLFWKLHAGAIKTVEPLQAYLEANLGNQGNASWTHNAWALALMFARGPDEAVVLPPLSEASLDSFVRRLLVEVESNRDDIAAFAISAAAPPKRGAWRPALDEQDRALLAAIVSAKPTDEEPRLHSDAEAAAVIAYHGEVVVDSKAALRALGTSHYSSSHASNDFTILRYFGASEADLDDIRRHGRLTRRRRASS